MYKMYNMKSPYHFCLPINKTVMFSAEYSIFEHWRKTIANRFRTCNDIAPIGYTLNFSIRNYLCYKPNKSLKIKGYYNINKVANPDRNLDVDIICINETSDIQKSIENLTNNFLL